MGELRVGAVVRGTTGELGKVDAIVIDPTTQSITHLVVAHEPLSRRVLVPHAAITEASSDVVTVDLTDEAFGACDLFDEPAYNEPGADFEVPAVPYDPGAYFLEPFASPLDGWALADHERIPKGEITIRRGDEVFSSDAVKVGHVDEFLVDPGDGHVTHVVLREGHALRHDDDVVVPVAGASFDEGRVVLGVDISTLHDLERIPVKRHGHVHQAGLAPGDATS
jgi:sporulation protein YlmC with PRC-barrel domain